MSDYFGGIELFCGPIGTTELPRLDANQPGLDRLGNINQTPAGPSTEAGMNAMASARTIETVIYATARPLLATRVRQILSFAELTFEPVMVRPERLSLTVAGKPNFLVLIDGDAKIHWKQIETSLQLSPQSIFVLCSYAISPDLVHAAINSGLHGLISTRAVLAEAGHALVQICKGERRMCFDGAPGSRSETSLTPSERKVLALAARGWRNGEIAQALSITEASVKVHVHHLLRKTGAKNRQELAKAVPAETRPEPLVEPAVEAVASMAAAAGAAAGAGTGFDSTWMFGDLDNKNRPIQEEI